MRMGVVGNTYCAPLGPMLCRFLMACRFQCFWFWSLASPLKRSEAFRVRFWEASLVDVILSIEEGIGSSLTFSWASNSPEKFSLAEAAAFSSPSADCVSSNFFPLADAVRLHSDKTCKDVGGTPSRNKTHPRIPTRSSSNVRPPMHYTTSSPSCDEAVEAARLAASLVRS